MKERIKKLFTNNLGIKIVSIAIAIVIWYAVVLYNDPVETSSYSVRVEVLNESYIVNGKQLYRIEDAYKSVKVNVRSNRSKIKELDPESIHVTADLTQIVDLERDPVMVPLEVSCEGFTADELALSRTTIPIIIENVASKEFPVTVSTGDSLPGKDYEVGELTPNPEIVIISGPETVINNIENVVAQIDITGMTLDGEKDAKLRIYNKDQSELPRNTIEDDLTFDGGIPDITVYVDLWKKLADIELDIEAFGTPAPGYQVSSVSTTPTEITIAGTDQALAAIESNGNRIHISDETINVENASADMIFYLTLANILPEDIKPSLAMNSTIIVNVTITPKGTKQFQFDVDDIKTNNLAPNLTVSYDHSDITLNISGTDEDLENLDLSKVSVALNLSGFAPGDYTVSPVITLPEGYTLARDVTVTIHIKEKVGN